MQKLSSFAPDVRNFHRDSGWYDEIRELIMGDEYEYPEGLCDPQEIESLLSWEDSARLWLSEAGCAWPGGRRNLDLMCAKLIELGLTEAADKVGALTLAFGALRDAGELEATEEDDDGTR